MRLNSRTQILTIYIKKKCDNLNIQFAKKFNNSHCDKTQNIKLGQKSNCDSSESSSSDSSNSVSSDSSSSDSSTSDIF